MAELVKKHHYKKNGVEQTAKTYSTIAEAGTEYIENKIDGVICYVAIGDTTDSRAIGGRVKKSSTAAERAILSTGKVPYTEMSWTVPGVHTWTCPGGVYRVLAATCGGGAGCLVATRPFSFGGVGSSFSYTAGSGGTSSFDALLSATGGVGFTYNKSTSLPEIDTVGVATSGYAGSPNGNNGWITFGDHIQSPTGKGAGFIMSFTKTIAPYSTAYGDGGYGKGGYGYMGNPDTNNVCVIGSSGGYNTGYVNVTPGTTYTIYVGAGGNAFIHDTSNSSPWAHNGNSGYVYIAFGGDINGKK